MQFAEEPAESGSSSQTSTGKVPWDNPFIRGLNIVKEQAPLKRPNTARVPGAGGGRKHVDYGLDVPTTKESRQAEKDREHAALKENVAFLEATMDQRVEAAVESRVQREVASKVDDAVASRVNEIIPAVVQGISGWFASGQTGPLPVISLGGSNSDNRSPTTRAQGAPAGNKIGRAHV